MKLQVVQDAQGKSTGVFIPMEDWTLIKNQYPDIESVDNDVAAWEKDLLDVRLAAIEKNPNHLKHGDMLLTELKRKI